MGALTWNSGLNQIDPKDPANRLGDFELGTNRRCPGGAVAPPPDGSAPAPDRRLRSHHDPARTMRRLALIAIALLAILVLAVGESSGDDGGDYTVRAVFDNAAFAVPDEEVRIAGAVVGSTEAVDLTEDNRAAISLKIDDDRFTPFHTDAECAIRSEGLLAVKFVECDPGTATEPELADIPDGERFSGEKLLPVENTTTPVDVDLVLNTYRQPTGRHLALLLSELGAGVAGRGKELNEIVHRANPSLRETDQVLRILAAQNRELAQFAVDADSVFSAVASKKRELASFISGAAGTAQAFGAPQRRAGRGDRAAARVPPRAAGDDGGSRTFHRGGKPGSRRPR